MSIPLVVLYAEDDENDAFFMKRAFAKMNNREALRIVSTGKQAVEYLAASGEYADANKYPRPQLVFLDVKMPEMSGLEALKWIRSRPEFDALPIVMFTSSTQESDVVLARQLAANAYVVKPSNADHLHRLLQTILPAANGSTERGARFNFEGNLI